MFSIHQFVINFNSRILQLSVITGFSFFSPVFFNILADVDECSKDNMCLHGQCVNTDGSFLCLCQAGFKLNADMADCEGKTLSWCHGEL